mmetsp:Transcript_13316/g.43850  ORF Transcript_13316/g.43850 Transcript_13316/m.43850 type:complete len:572 (+) Transcript_13316:3-1718(+)|eukprot:CAMPEP_0170139282 /NCGR_PEP_ID=MMETSP0033_2-20121228/5533_1 /TAXON_ID=195969 /ORGANISM="Dolichomastix tenuilepis, Strain CCMP3274" /LENGTH=571 /DNA_ID=CAMNT_0010375381 /DNA_START=1 /DNA_END=1712 /DNA_ORIENTATION=-
MGKGRRQFIDKKKSTTYTLLAAPGESEEDRSFVRTDDNPHERGVLDVSASGSDEEDDDDGDEELPPGLAEWVAAKTGGGGGGGAGGASAPLAAQKRREILELGLADDGYDYTKHLRMPDAKGGAGVRKVLAPVAPRAPKDVRRVDARGIEIVEADAAPTVEVLPIPTDAPKQPTRAGAARGGAWTELEEAEALLDDADKNGVGDLLDDFVLAANAEPDEGSEAGDGGERLEWGPGWDYRHPPRGEAIQEEEEDEEEAEGEEEESGSGSESREAAGGVPPERGGALGLLDAQFEALLAGEYSDGEIGELDDDAERIRGTRTLDEALAAGGGEPHASAILPEGAVLIGKAAGASRAALAAEAEVAAAAAERTKLLALAAIEEDEALGPEGASAAASRLLEELSKAPDREEWDCETIVSTYSNLDNHPGLIGEGDSLPRRRKKKSSPATDGEGEAAAEQATASGAEPKPQIKLSKHGLPVTFYDSGKGDEGAAAAALGEDAEDELSERWRSDIRRKGLTPEEKRARKAEVKAGRRLARAEKKATKNTFSAAIANSQGVRATGAVKPGASVVPLS